MTPTLDLACQLISRPSLTPEDGGCLGLLEQRLAPLGFAFEHIERGGVKNLWARRGFSGPVFCFAGHVDVVPTGPEERWQSPPFTPSQRDGRLYGRGSADMKGSIAAFVVALERFLAEHPSLPGSIALLITSDEEGDAVDGTVRVVEELARRGQLLDWCLVGEPTSEEWTGDTIKNGRRGSLTGLLTVRGVQGHVAYPHLAKNPVHLAAAALAELAATGWDEGNEFFPPTTFQISNVHAGTGVDNVIPGEMQVVFNFRHSTASTVDSLKERTLEILNRHEFEYALQWKQGGKPYLTERGSLTDTLEKAVHAVTGRTSKLSTAGGTSDGRFIADICPQVVELGPLNASIHKVDEWVGIGDLENLEKIYHHLLGSLFAPTPTP